MTIDYNNIAGRNGRKYRDRRLRAFSSPAENATVRKKITTTRGRAHAFR